MKRLHDKIAVITGAAGGIGLVTAKTFVANGAKVIIWDVADEAGNKAQDELPDTHYMHVDVSDQAAVRQAVEQVVERFGKIDILVNNAGITRDATLLKMKEEQWDSVINVNLKGVFNGARVVAEQMAVQSNGVILNTSSVVALYGNFGQTNYVAAKSGIIGMTKVWARELGRKGIRVNAVAPGFIATEMIDSVPEKVIDKLKAQTPLQRLGDPQDIANAYLFLASDEAAFITGTVLSVDGGLVI